MNFLINSFLNDMPNAAIVLTIILIIILIVTTILLLYLLFSSSFSRNRVTNSSPSNPTNSTAPAILSCPVNQCATSLITGNKRCPPENSNIQIEYSPVTEACNSRFACDNRATPFAGQSDGSAILSGVCQDGIECPCFRRMQCPDYIASVFTSSNGNIVNPLGGQRISFPQISRNGLNGASDSLGNPALTYCTVPLSWLPIANPGCGFVPGGFTNNMNYNELKLCMGQVKNCNGSLNSPCLYGTLAVISNDVESLTQANVNQSQVGCVTGNPCNCEEIAIYDTQLGGVICRQLPAI